MACAVVADFEIRLMRSYNPTRPDTAPQLDVVIREEGVGSTLAAFRSLFEGIVDAADRRIQFWF